MITDSNLYKEIYEQPEVIDRFITRQRAAIEGLCGELRGCRITHVTIAARGTSDNAGRYAKYVLGAMNGLPVALAAPSLFSLYKRPPVFKDALVVGISQSGKSPDIVEVLAEARRQGVLTVAITNQPNSELARAAGFVIDLMAGEEKSVAATKTYTAELVAVALLSASLSSDVERLEALEKIPQAISTTLSMEDEIAQIAARYRSTMSRGVIIGRGYNYATVFEMALKMKELAYTTIEPYSSADFMHGPVAMIEPRFPVFMIAPTGMMLGEMKELLGRIKRLKPEVLGISDDRKLLDQVQVPLELPATVPEWLSPLTCIIPGQLFAMHLAHARGQDVDQPRSIQKVTETY